MAGMSHDKDGVGLLLDYIESRIENLRTELHRRVIVAWVVLIIMMVGQVFSYGTLIFWIFTQPPPPPEVHPFDPEEMKKVPGVITSMAIFMNFELLVQNGKAKLVAVIDVFGNMRYEFDLKASRKVKERLDKLVKESVYESGGSLNIPGRYSLSAELQDYLYECLSKGEIRFVPRPPKPME